MAARNWDSSEKRKSAQSFKTACRSTTRAPYLTPRRPLTRSSLERWLDGNDAVPTSALRSDSPLRSPAEVRNIPWLSVSRRRDVDPTWQANILRADQQSLLDTIAKRLAANAKYRRWSETACAVGGGKSPRTPEPKANPRTRRGLETRAKCHRIRCPAGTAQQGRLPPLDRAECAGGGDAAACKFAGPDRGASGQRELPSAGSLQADRKEREIAEPAVDPGFCCVQYLIYGFGSLKVGSCWHSSSPFDEGSAPLRALFGCCCRPKP